MKVKKFDSKEEWFEGRKGKITGSKAGDIGLKRGGERKKGFYELIAENVAIPDGEEVPVHPMDRGSYLEAIAVDKFIAETGKNVDKSLVIWCRDDDENIAVSPDGIIGKTEALECKCLNSASHIEAWYLNRIPSEYEEQYIQYFVVNDKLKKLYFAFYDPRIPAKDFFYFTIERKDIEEKIKEQLEEQLETIREVERVTTELTF
jgi:predicted phage-related endonuclease